MDDDAWFERHTVNGRLKRGLTPLNWKGYATIAGFVLAMVGGGALFLLIALSTRNIAVGAGVFAVCAAIGGGTLIWASARKIKLVPYEQSAMAQRAPLSWTPIRMMMSIFSALVGGSVVFAAVYLVSKNELDAAIAATVVALAGATTTVLTANMTQRAKARANS